MTEKIVDMKDKRNLVHKQQITCQEDRIYGTKAGTTTKKKSKVNKQSKIKVTKIHTTEFWEISKS